jgi:hypothetical protein
LTGLIDSSLLGVEEVALYFAALGHRCHLARIAARSTSAPAGKP